MGVTSAELQANGARGFDDQHPPDPKLIDDCVHCGFCLPTCPTYVLWGEEMDSPRGRIYLMKLAAEGEIALNDTVVQHFDRCLGCMACVTAAGRTQLQALVRRSFVPPADLSAFSLS